MKNNVVLSFGSIARVKVEVDKENNSKTTRIVCDSEMQLIESINLCNGISHFGFFSSAFSWNADSGRNTARKSKMNFVFIICIIKVRHKVMKTIWIETNFEPFPVFQNGRN